MARLLLVDDDPAILTEQLTHLFESKGMEIELAISGEEALRKVAVRSPDVILLDLTMPGLSSLEMHERLREIDAHIPVIFTNASTTTEVAIEAMRHGAHDYLFKPVDLKQLEAVVNQAINLNRRTRELAAKGDSPETDNGRENLVGRCPAMVEVYKAVGRVADQKVTVLITGESGTGKELVSRAIYEHSDRAKQPFLAINCAAIPENLLESELFGHEKGAFTGADRQRIGKFEQCDGGTLFLDEIGDMPLATQAKILRLLEDQKFERVGGNQTIQTDVRLIAATNKDLKTMSETGKFRADLYYRLSVFDIPLPPLRQRNGDLFLLVRFFLRRSSAELGRDVREVAPEAMQKLSQYSWPGNVRELQSVLKQALLKCHGAVLLREFLPDLENNDRASLQAVPEPQFNFEAFIRNRISAGTNCLQVEANLQLDRLLIKLTLEATSGNQLQAAKILGIARQTLRKRVREMGLNITTSVADAVETPVA